MKNSLVNYRIEDFLTEIGRKNYELFLNDFFSTYFSIPGHKGLADLSDDSIRFTDNRYEVYFIIGEREIIFPLDPEDFKIQDYEKRALDGNQIQHS